MLKKWAYQVEEFLSARPPRKGNPDADNSERDQHPVLSLDAEDRKALYKPVAHRSPHQT
jgi:hypothetical protein